MFPACDSGYRGYKLATGRVRPTGGLAAGRIPRGGLAGIGEIAVAEQNPKLYILDRHNEI